MHSSVVLPSVNAANARFDFYGSVASNYDMVGCSRSIQLYYDRGLERDSTLTGRDRRSELTRGVANPFDEGRQINAAHRTEYDNDFFYTFLENCARGAFRILCVRRLRAPHCDQNAATAGLVGDSVFVGRIIAAFLIHLWWRRMTSTPNESSRDHVNKCRFSSQTQAVVYAGAASGFSSGFCFCAMLGEVASSGVTQCRVITLFWICGFSNVRLNLSLAIVTEIDAV